MSDEFDDAVAATLRPDRGQGARVGFSIAAGTDADAYAEAQRVARRTGVPTVTVLNKSQEMKQRALVGGVDFDALAKTAPATAALLADVEKARIAYDDLPGLTAIERSFLGSITEPVQRGLAQGDRGLTLLLDQMGLFNGLSRQRAAVAAAHGVYYDPSAELAARLAQQQREIEGYPVPDDIARGMQDISSAQTMGAAFTAIRTNPRAVLETALQSLGASAPALVGAAGGSVFGPGGTAAGAGLGSFAVEYSNTLQDVLADRGVDGSDAMSIRTALNDPEIMASARDKALKRGIPVAIFDALTAGLAGRLLAGAKPAAISVGARAGGELGLQAAGGAAGEASAQLATGEYQPGDILMEAFAEMPTAVVEVPSNYRRAMMKAQRAQKDTEFLDTLNKTVQSDKLAARDPETFQQFVANAAEAGPVQQVFIDANTLMQSGVAEQVAALSPAVAAQLPEAVQTGGQIAIPVDEYAARIAPSEYAQGLLNHLKIDPEGFSRAEADAYMQGQAEELKAEVERALAEQEGDAFFRRSADAVRAGIKDQMDTAGRFTPQVNDAYSSMMGSFYAVQAARLGVTPEDLFQRFPLKVVAELPDGERRFAQGERGPFGPVFTEFKGDARGAIAKLMETKSGEAVGALYHPDIGDIDLVWGHEGTGGSDGYGLAKLAKYHPEVLDDLQGILSAMTVVSRSANRVNLESADHRAGVRLTWDGHTKQWLLTAFRKKIGGGDATTTDIGTLSGTDDTASRADASNDSIDQTLRDFYQGEGRGPRGAYAPDTLTIFLLKNADLSTFPHESGHFYLDALERLAADPASPSEIRADMDAVLRWIGVAGETSEARLATWRGMSLEEKRPGHEKWSRGFEAYLFEGKAPSIELHGLFQRFRAWLLNVYRDLKALDVTLTPEVRGVFDRMLATSDQIALAEQGRSMMPLFASAEQAGMSAEEFAAYQALGVDATNEAIEDLQARGLRDMQWLRDARSRIVQRLQKEAAARRADMRGQVADEVNAQPVYRADRFLRYGELEIPSGASQTVRRAAEQANLEGTKLSLSALKEMYGDAENAIWRYLPTGRHGLAATEGMHPDIAADIFGFTSGDELVRKLLAAAPRNEEIEALTDVRMLERYGELSTPEAIERAADAAIHNDARSRFVATEANALARAAAGPVEQTGVDRRGRPVVRRILPQAAKEYAQALIARLKVRDIRPGQYAAAEVRAAKAAARALKAGDLATAAAEKRNQLIQNQAARAAYNAQDEIDRGLRYLRKFDRNPKGLDADYADQINQLLERFDLRAASNKAVDKRASLAKWLESQRESGFEPDIPADLENEAFRTSYKNMTVEDFRGLGETVRQIEHLGRLKNRLLTTKKQRAYEAVRDEIAASIEQHANGREADTRTPTTNAGRAVRGLKRFWAAHIKAATWARTLDGNKDGGSMWEYFIRTANERGDMETTMRADATARLSEILSPVLKLGRMGGKGQFFPTIGRSLNREARLALALNIGNEGNMQRLLDGEGWTLAQIAPVLRSLAAEEWHAVQAVWDHFESYRPQIAAKERRIYGREPEWVEPRSFEIATADGQTVQMKGGYYPIQYDPAASQRAEEHADAEGARRQLQGAYTSATTRRSFTKSRVDEVTGRPLLYTLSGLYSGVNDVIHDLAWHEWLIDANRLLRSGTIDRAIRSHYGPEVKQQFKSWVQDVAEGEKGASNAAELAIGRLRQGVSAAGLGFNVMSAFIQPLGLTQSIVRVGAPWVGRGIVKYLAGPLALTRTINSKSEFMTNRARTRFRELNELRNRVQDQSAFQELAGRYAYFLMMRFQQIADTPTWWGAYEKAIAEGNEESRAVALADQAVIDSQGGGQTKDLSAIERGGSAQKLFTVFYSFMNTALNLGVAQTMGADTPAKRARLAADYILLYVVPAILSEALKDALTPGDSGEWDDPEKLAKKLVAAQIDYLMGLMFLAREFSDTAKAIAGLDTYGYRGPAGVRLIPDLTKFAQQANQAEFDDAFRKALVNVIGDFSGLPSAQVNRTVTGVQAIARGDTENPASIVFGFQNPR